MSAPAEIARLSTKATVGTRARSSASRITTAASTRPSNVIDLEDDRRLDSGGRV